MEVIGIKPGEDSIAFSKTEWKHFLDEVEMRKGKEIEKCINNARYLAMLERAEIQSALGQGKMFTLEELEKIVNGECSFSG